MVPTVTEAGPPANLRLPFPVATHTPLPCLRSVGTTALRCFLLEGTQDGVTMRLSEVWTGEATLGP